MISKHSLAADGLKERRGAGHRKNDPKYVNIGRHGAPRFSVVAVRRLIVKNLGASLILLVVLTLLGLYWRFAAVSYHHTQKNPSKDQHAAGVLSSENNVGGGVRKTGGVAQQDSLPQQQQHSLAEFWILETDLGNIRIRLRPDLSPESVAYIQQVVHTNTCQDCRIYRADKPGIMQGIVKSDTVAVPTAYGNCPYPQNDTKKEVCHGPIMTHGMVGWAGGLLGPDFFIDSYERPADFWGTLHTVFGEIEDDASFQLLDLIYEKPTELQGRMKMLLDPIKFTMRLETAPAEAQHHL